MLSQKAMTPTPQILSMSLDSMKLKYRFPHSQKNSQYFNNRFRKSFIQVTSKSRDTLKRKSLLNLTIQRPILSKARDKENKITFNFTKQIIENKQVPLKLKQSSNYQLKKNYFQLPSNYYVRVELEDPYYNDEHESNPFTF